MSTWVDKYRPKQSFQIIGQANNVKHLKDWLINYDSPRNKFKAVLMSGPPGIGKTTTAQLVCKEAGYDYIEMNASDQRNKKAIEEQLSSMVKNSRLNFFGKASASKNALIMDEVDGMAGNEDRGGVAQLIQIIKQTKLPIICICNDASHPKVRSLSNYCETLTFYKPKKEQVRAVVMSISSKENIKIDQDTIYSLIESANYDIRQVVNYLSLFKQSQTSNSNDIKTVRLSTFDATKKGFTHEECHNIHDRFEVFFADYNIMALFMYENYVHVKPQKARNELDSLRAVSKSIDSMCIGDLVDKEIRSNQSWSMLPTQALLSTVIPTFTMSGKIMSRLSFPAFLGKLSNANKRMRLMQDLKSHLSLSISGGRNALNLDYLEILRERLSKPMVDKGAQGVDDVISFMREYSLRKEDMDSIMDLSLWSNQKDSMSSVDSKTKAALTRTYNKAGIVLPYSTEEKGPKKRKYVSLDAEEEEGDEEDDDEDNNIIKPKKVVKKAEPKEPKAKAEPKEPKGAKAKAEPKEPKPKAEPKEPKVKEPKAKAEPKTKTEARPNGHQGTILGFFKKQRTE